MPIMTLVIRFPSRFSAFRPAVVILLAAFCMNLAASRPADAFEHILRSIVADDSVPSCEQSSVIDTIRSKFDTTDARILHAGLSLGTIDRITQAYAGQNDPSRYARRYCEARVTLSDGKRSTLYYLLEQNAGFVGVTWNVEFCVLGYEPWHIHDGRCHTVRHQWW
jgi:hypothetical protein